MVVITSFIGAWGNTLTEVIQLIQHQSEADLGISRYLQVWSTSCCGINSLSLITKSTSPDSSTYHLTTKSTWSPQLDVINSSLWVWRSSCYCLGSHSEVLGRNALPSWSRPSAIFSPIQGWASHSLYWSLDPGSCSQVLPISLSPSSFTSVPISQHSQGWNLSDDSTLSIWGLKINPANYPARCPSEPGR